MGTDRPTVFIMSSTEALPAAKALQNQLGSMADVIPWWSSDVMPPSTFPWDNLETMLDSLDFGVVVASDDDRRTSRGATTAVPAIT